MSAQTDIERIAEGLRNISRDGVAEAVQIKVIGLDEVRAAAGDRWPRMRERVRSGSMNMLNRLAGPGDVVIPAGDGFLVILAESHTRDAQRRGEEMSRALHDFYLGEQELATLRPEAHAQRLDAEGLRRLVSASIKAEAGAPDARRRTEIVAAPIYLPHDRKLSAQVIAPVVGAAGVKRIGYDADFIHTGQHQPGADFLELDILLLRSAISRLHAALDAGRLQAIGVHVHASTMQQRKSRDVYLHELSALDEEMHRLLFVIIGEIEKGAPLISIADWSSALRQHAARVWLDLHHTDHSLSNVAGAGAWAAGFQLPNLSGLDNPRAQRMVEHAGTWSRTLRAQGMRLFVHNFRTKDVLDAAARAGVDFAMGDGLWPFAQVAEQKQQDAHAVAASRNIAPPAPLQ
ncbi:MAG TPA: hypothetical protein VG943_17760 [Caulobacterales bacterium]|nr:hypothetical protein [Caulobacterales bacterium]